jgi:hypothetical protein
VNSSIFFTNNPKGGFISESGICFSNLQISKKDIPKIYPELEIQISRQQQQNVIGGKFKFQAQDRFLE